MQVQSFVIRSGQGGTGIPKQQDARICRENPCPAMLLRIHEATLADNFETASVMAFGNQKGKPV